MSTHNDSSSGELPGYSSDILKETTLMDLAVFYLDTGQVQSEAKRDSQNS